MNTSLRAADPYADTTFDPGCASARRMFADIVANPRVGRGRSVGRPRPRALVAAGVLIAAGVAIVIVAGTRGPGRHHVEALGADGYRLAVRADGSVRVLVRWDEVRDPAALQASLDQAQAHTLIWVTHSDPVTAWCTGPVHPFTGQLAAGVIDYNIPHNGGGFLIRPQRFPAGVTLLIRVDLATGSRSAAPTGSANGPAMSGFATTWVAGPVAGCV
jgi:hypothetical protein